MIIIKREKYVLSIRENMLRTLTVDFNKTNVYNMCTLDYYILTKGLQSCNN